MKNEIPSILIDKYLRGTASAEEREQLLDWYRSQDHELVEWLSGNENEEELVYSRIFSNIENKIGTKMAPDLQNSAPIISTLPARKTNWYRVAAAAVILTAAGYAIQTYRGILSEETVPVLVFKNDVKPGKNKAILKLADGSEIDLDDAANANLVQQKELSITKTADGQIAYSLQNNIATQTKEVKYNTVSTPRGGQYRIILPDGTKVWLNASSSIHFPTYFSAGERKVEISGEVYFEVTKNAKMPFRVISGTQELEVLGTQFNVDAYGDEQNIKTTLAQGSVKINRINSAVSSILKPGDQSQLSTEGNNRPIKIVPADLEEVLAWKNEAFAFNNTPFNEVMQQIERWYDVEPVYKGSKPNLFFTGIIPRNSKLSTFLRAIEGTGGVKFGIEGKKIIIYKLK